MFRLRFALLPLLTVLGLPAGAAAQESVPAAVPGELVVRFDPSAGAAERGEAREQADVDVIRGLRVPRAQLLEVDPGQSVQGAISQLEALDGVAYAEPNWIFRASAVNPNDPRFLANELWGLDKIYAPEAWTIATGASSAVVAVVDTGVAYDHPDLAANIWSNPGETANGADDGDANTLIDDIRGWDFVDDDNDPRDIDGHGTHVAGTIAGVGNNALGVTGVSWAARIMPVRVLGADGTGTYADIVSGFDYAGANGARIVNASLGGEAVASQVQMLTDVVARYPDTLFVAAAGNDTASNDTTPQYPCNLPAANLVCVASTTSSDGLSSFSNFGDTSVDLGAPGSGIWSTVPATNTTQVDTFDGTLASWTAGGSGGTFQATASPSLPFAPADYQAGSRAGVLDDAPAAPGYQSGEDFWIRSNAKVGTAGSPGCFLTYDVRYYLDENFDRLRVQTSPTGTGATWVTRENITGYEKDWVATETWLGPDPEVYLRFRLVADDEPTTAQFDGVQIDDLAVRCVSTAYAADSTTDYARYSGTSMATPHVAGAAAVLVGKYPSASAANLRSWLLTSGDSLTALAGKTVTGRRLNLFKALQTASGSALDPLVGTGAASEITQTSAVLNGTIDPNGTATSYRFEWGESTDYGSTSAITPVGATGAVDHALSALTPGTVYHYRVVALRGGEPVGLPGLDATFTTTAPDPPVEPDPPAAESEAGPIVPVPVSVPDDLVSPPDPIDDTFAITATAPLGRLTPAQPVGGVRLRVDCTATCAVFAKVTGPRSLRPLLGDRILIRRTATLPAGSRVVRLTLSKARLRRLRRAGVTRVKATLVLNVGDAAGQITRSSRSVRIRIAPR